MALIVIDFVWEYHVNLRTFEDFNYYYTKCEIKCTTSHPRSEDPTLLGKLLVSDGFAEAMPDVGKYDD